MVFSDGHAVIIGVGRYRFASQADVPIAVEDARSVGQVLQEPTVCGYPPDQVLMLTDQDASKEGVLSALDELARRTGSEHTVFLFYCGHGAYGTDGRFYLVSHDAHIRGKQVIAGTGVSENELLDKLRQLKSRRVLMVFNTCYAGSISPALDIDPSSLEAQSLPQSSSTAILGTGSGRIILTASSESQKSYIGPGKLSLFAQALVDGLQGEGVRDSGGYISAYDLYAHIYERVTHASRELLQQTQEPELTVIKGVGAFAVALYKGSQTHTEFSSEQTLPAHTRVRAEKPEEARRMFQLKLVETGGGAYAEGDIDTDGGSFTGRDQIVQGDQVHGDQISGDSIAVGDITGSNVAIGRGAKATQTSQFDHNEIERFRIRMQRSIGSAPPDVQARALDAMQALIHEINKGDGADDTRMATLITDLAESVPQTAGVISELFAGPAVEWIAGDVTRFVLAKIR